MFKYLFLVALSAIALQAKISITDPYAKATPPNAKNSAAFLTIQNDGSKDAELILATNSVTPITELHTHINENGMKKMIQIPSIKIPAKSKVELKPGGLHIMLIGLNKQLNPDDNIDLNLTFKDGKRYELTNIPVKKIVPTKMH